MPKLPYLNREDLPSEKKHIFDHIEETRNTVPRVFQILLNSPDAAQVVSAIGEYIRYKCSLEPAIREIAILATARELNNEYEWTQHIPFAQKAGVGENVINAIRSGRAPMGIPPKEGVFAQAAKELVRDGSLNNFTFQAIEHLLGPAQAIDLIILVGYYSLMSTVIKTLEVELEEGIEPNLET